jgi:hypothetical protein
MEREWAFRSSTRSMIGRGALNDDVSIGMRQQAGRFSIGSDIGERVEVRDRLATSPGVFFARAGSASTVTEKQPKSGSHLLAEVPVAGSPLDAKPRSSVAGGT